MTEADIPKRVVVVLLFLVILVSFLGTFTVLQLFTTAPRAVGTSESESSGVVSVYLQPQPVKAESSKQADGSATVSIKIEKYEG